MQQMVQYLFIYLLTGYIVYRAGVGELGFGPNEPKSATKPMKNQPLSGIDVFEYVFARDPFDVF
jgi:hypothetical protein